MCKNKTNKNQKNKIIFFQKSLLKWYTPQKNGAKKIKNTIFAMEIRKKDIFGLDFFIF